jgi:hypothetical protein
LRQIDGISLSNAHDFSAERVEQNGSTEDHQIRSTRWARIGTYGCWHLAKVG